MKTFTSFTISGGQKTLIEFLNYNGISIFGQPSESETTKDVEMFYKEFKCIKIGDMSGTLYATYFCEQLPIHYNIPEQSFNVQTIIDRFREPDEAGEVTKLKARIAQLESELKRCKDEEVIALKSIKSLILTIETLLTVKGQ